MEKKASVAEWLVRASSRSLRFAAHFFLHGPHFAFVDLSKMPDQNKRPKCYDLWVTVKLASGDERHLVHKVSAKHSFLEVMDLIGSRLNLKGPDLAGYAVVYFNERFNEKLVISSNEARSHAWRENFFRSADKAEKPVSLRFFGRSW